MIFPADEAGNRVASLHPRAFEHPMVRLGDGPVATPIDRFNVAHAHQQALIRTGSTQEIRAELKKEMKTHVAYVIRMG